MKFDIENPYGRGAHWTAVQREDDVALLNPNNQLRGRIDINQAPPVVEGPVAREISEELVARITEIVLDVEEV